MHLFPVSQDIPVTWESLNEGGQISTDEMPIPHCYIVLDLVSICPLFPPIKMNG